MNFWRVFLIPFACLYGLVVRIRHFLFNHGFLVSESFPVPVIGVGNLSLGGTGKTPFIEYLIMLLKEEKNVATLSRGYGRKTKGFRLAGPESSYKEIGDEPMQYYHKFGSSITVAVDEDRRNGIRQLLKTDKKIDVILLDDSFQHRYVKPGLSILLTDSHKLYVDNFLLPTGTLRDTVAAAKRADIVIVTKTHRVLSPFVRRSIVEKLKVKPYQQLYFSFIVYGKFVPFPGVEKYVDKKKPGLIVLFSGIANPAPLIEHTRTLCNELVTLKFSDHHVYTKKDLSKIRSAFDDAFQRRKIILTTEKDAMRLINSPYFSALENLPLFYIPIRAKLHEEGRHNFRNQILEYVKKDR
ncbi:MAG: tetraacyldisaccharide 4'-kinase [Bacteroidales bacterium]|nr:tetraacyldisaccharide 4'-kinase [Bacteroidales bacterium]